MSGITGKLEPIVVDTRLAWLTDSLPGRLLRAALASRRRGEAAPLDESVSVEKKGEAHDGNGRPSA